MEENKKKKSKLRFATLILLGFLIVSLLILSAGFAFYQIENTEGESVSKGTINLECLQIEYTEEGTLSPDYAYPIKDEYALEHITPIKVKITNTCETNLEDINYSLVLTTLTNSDNNITSDKMRVNSKRSLNLVPASEPSSYDNFLKPSYLNSLSELTNEYSKEALESDILNREKDGAKVFEGYTVVDSRVIDENFIKSNSESVYEIQLWIDYYEGDSGAYSGNAHDSGFDNSTKNSTFVGALSVVANPYEKYTEPPKSTIDTLRENAGSYLTTNPVGGMYRYQGTNNVPNWIIFGTKEECNKDEEEKCTNTKLNDMTYEEYVDKYMYRIIGITEEGQLYLLKETFLKEDSVTGFAWNDEYYSTGSLSYSCPDGNCPEWNESDLFQRINGKSNGTSAGTGGYSSKADTDIFVDNEYYDYLKSGDKVNGGGTEEENGEVKASDWYKLIAYHDWMYGDTTTSSYSGNTLYAIETGDKENGQTNHYAKGEDGAVTSQSYTWTNTVNAKISLMYLHDVAYAYPEGNPSYTNVKNSWIHFQKDGYNSSPTYEWLSTRWGIDSTGSADVRARTVPNDGGLYSRSNLRGGHGVRPVFYLSSEAKITGGDGTQSLPYILG